MRPAGQLPQSILEMTTWQALETFIARLFGAMVLLLRMGRPLYAFSVPEPASHPICVHSSSEIYAVIKLAPSRLLEPSPRDGEAPRVICCCARMRRNPAVCGN